MKANKTKKEESEEETTRIEERPKDKSNAKDTSKNSAKENSKSKNNKNKKDSKNKADLAKKASKSKEESTKEEIEPVDKEHVKLIKFEEIKNIFKKKKAIPKEDLKKINQPVFHNILMAIIVIVYFIFLILGFYNIENSVYQTDLKVFAMCTLFIAIVLLEKAYKKDSGKLAMFGIETIFIAIITLALIYINIMLSDRYISIVLSISYILAIYYVIKSIVLYIRGRKKYFVDDMKEIMNTDE